jgi:hypothetical protein
VAATAEELDPDETATAPVLAFDDGATEAADDDGAAPCHPELLAELLPW